MNHFTVFIHRLYAIRKHNGHNRFKQGSPGSSVRSVVIASSAVGTASVSVEIKDGRIADVTVTDDAETVSVMYPMVEDAAEEVAQQVVQNQSVENITVADTHTYSAQAVLDAVSACLEDAAK